MLRVGAGQRSRRIFPIIAPGSLGGIAPIFYLPLNDLGGGVVNLVPGFSAGSPTPTFTRAAGTSNNAWTKLASGLWGFVGPNVARFRYIGNNTVQTSTGGFFPEPAATQLVTPTAAIRDMTDASWVKVNVTAVKNATGIDGVANSASTITATAPAGTILQTLVAASTGRTYSAFVRRKTGVGTLTIQQGATTLDVTALINSVTYTRVKLNASVLNSAFGFTIGTSGDAFELDFNQFELLPSTSAEPTSPMDTTGAARSADSLTYASAGNIDFTQGSAYAELSQNGVAASNGALAATASGRIIWCGAPTDIRIYDGTTTDTKTGLTDMTTAVRKRATSWGGTGQSATGDGAAPQVSVFDGSMGSGAVLFVGDEGTGLNQWRGTIDQLRIFPLQNADAWLQTVTT